MGLVPHLKQVTLTAGGTAQPLLVPGDVMNNIVTWSICTTSGTAYIGDSTVVATTKKGIPVTTTPLIFVEAGRAGYDLAQVYFDGSTAAVVEVLYFERIGG